MNMVRKIVSCIREYKKDSILSIVFIGLEVVMECFMPLIMTVLVDLFYAIETGKKPSPKLLYYILCRQTRHSAYL